MTFIRAIFTHICRAILCLHNGDGLPVQRGAALYVLCGLAIATGIVRGYVTNLSGSGMAVWYLANLSLTFAVISRYKGAKIAALIACLVVAIDLVAMAGLAVGIHIPSILLLAWAGAAFYIGLTKINKAQSSGGA